MGSFVQNRSGRLTYSGTFNLPMAHLERYLAFPFDSEDQFLEMADEPPGCLSTIQEHGQGG